jgi:predicted Zn-dependent protease
MRRSIFPVVTLGLLALLVAGCAVNPVTGRRELSLVSPQRELAIGGEGYKAAVAEYGVYADTALQNYVNAVGQRVAAASHLPGLAWHFTVLDDPTVNAFAMPGGYIYITRGILAHLNSEAQLAGVLGHEIGHVTHRHTAEQMTQQQLYGLGFGVASIASKTVARYGDLAQQGLSLLFLKYSRDDETEADELGVSYAAAAGYDPREIPATYAMLKRVSDQAGQRLPGYLSTHPDPGNREATTSTLAQRAVQGRTNLTVNGRGYVQRLDGVLFGDDPRQGYFDGDVFYHPGLRFQLTLPAGWKHQNTRTALVAQEPAQKAVMQLGLAAAGTLSPGDYVQQLVNGGKIAEARGRSETLGGLPAWVGRAAFPQENAAAVVLAAGWIRRADTLMLQVVGRSQQVGDADEGRIFTSLRTLRPLTDAARLNVNGDRVLVEKVGATGSLQTTLEKLGGPSSLYATDALINNLELDETVHAGTLLKRVVPGRH